MQKLPLIAEEGEYRDKISREELSRFLKEETLASNDAINVVLEMVEMQWTKAGLLEPFEKELGNWQFISFSASLAARSWLDVMSDKDGYWFTNGWWADKANSETQRELLKKTEELRLKAKNNGAIHPIRQVYVAWALVKLDDHILFVEREDHTREGVPHFVLPGGRLNIHDLRNNLEGKDQHEHLKILQSPSSHKAIESLTFALKRELEEELRLFPSEYSIGEVFKLNPYNKLEGAGANHAYTCYEISLFTIDLEFKGFSRLAILDNHTGHEWFNLEEVSRAQKGNKRAFLDAWQEHHGWNEENLLEQLDLLDESFKDSCYFNEMIDIPVNSGDPFHCGPTGKNERECLVNLDNDELKLLLAMAWHRRHGTDFPLELKKSISSGIYGWFEVKNRHLVELMKSLQQKLNNRELPLIESHDRNWFRLNVSKENLFFSGEFFTYELRKPRPDGYEIMLFPQFCDTPLGHLPKIDFSYPLHSESMYNYLKSLEKDEEDEDIYADQDNMMRKHLDPLVKQAGLRKLVRTSGGLREIICLPENP